MGAAAGGEVGFGGQAAHFAGNIYARVANADYQHVLTVHLFGGTVLAGVEDTAVKRTWKLGYFGVPVVAVAHQNCPVMAGLACAGVYIGGSNVVASFWGG